MISHSEIGRKIRDARNNKGLRLLDIEKACGVQKIVLSRLERGFSRPHAETVYKVAKAIGDPELELLALEYAEIRKQEVLEKERIRKNTAYGDPIGFKLDREMKRKIEEYAAEENISLASWLKKLIATEIKKREGKK